MPCRSSRRNRAGAAAARRPTGVPSVRGRLSTSVSSRGSQVAERGAAETRAPMIASHARPVPSGHSIPSRLSRKHIGSACRPPRSRAASTAASSRCRRARPSRRCRGSLGAGRVRTGWPRRTERGRRPHRAGTGQELSHPDGLSNQGHLGEDRPARLDADPARRPATPFDTSTPKRRLRSTGRPPSSRRPFVSVLGSVAARRWRHEKAQHRRGVPCRCTGSGCPGGVRCADPVG